MQPQGILLTKVLSGGPPLSCAPRLSLPLWLWSGPHHLPCLSPLLRRPGWKCILSGSLEGHSLTSLTLWSAFLPFWMNEDKSGNPWSDTIQDHLELYVRLGTPERVLGEPGSVVSLFLLKLSLCLYAHSSLLLSPFLFPCMLLPISHPLPQYP